MITQDKPFVGKKHGTDKIGLSGYEYINMRELRPTEIHLKDDGTNDNKPSITMVMSLPITENELIPAVYGELSIEMWNEGLKDIGYKIVPI